MKKILVLLMAITLMFSLGTVTAYAGEADAVTLKLKVKEGTDITETVNEALKQARDNATAEKPYEIIIPSGTYKLSSQLRIYSNTTLVATGATINYKNTAKESHNMIMSGDRDYNISEVCAGYDGFENITIKGGKWVSTSYNTSTIIRIAHAKNVTLEGVTVSGGACSHQVEICAIDGFYVKNCSFLDLEYKNSESGSDKQEALQLDIPVDEAVYPDIYWDGTPMKNVEITGCTFSNVPRGVGSHTMLMGAYHSNIKITNNVFKNISEEAIVGLNYYDCEISKNTITNCGAGVLFQYFKADTGSIYSTASSVSYKNAKNVIHDAKTTISNNTIKTKYYKNCDEVQGIKVYGVNLAKKSKGGDGKYIPAGDYYISGVTIENNKITTAGHGIHLVNSKECLVNKNTITGANVNSKDPLKKAYDGIFLSTTSTKNTLTNNTISKMVRNGIFLMDASSVTTISGHNIKNCKNYAIGLFDSSKVTGDIKDNTISGTGIVAISLSTKSTVKNIKNNNISATNGTSISVWNGCTVSGDITKNTIVDSAKGKFGIVVQKKSKVKGDISSNTIKKKKNKYSSDKAILVYDKSTVTGSVKSNTISNTATYGVMVSGTSVVGGIESNKITKPGKSAILLDKSATVKGKIFKNTITDTPVKANAIHITGKATVTSSIEKNKIVKKSNKNSCNIGILVYDSAAAKGGILGNTIKNTKGHAISISKKGSAGAISSNVINNCGGSAIFVYNSSKVVGVISKNKLTKMGGSGIYISGSCTVKGDVKENNIEKPKEKGIFVYNKSTVKSILNNTITGAVSQGINLASTKNKITISGNTIKNGSQNGILIQTGTTKYKVTIKKNTILVPKNRYAIHATSGYVVANGNTVSKNSYQIKLDKGVKGSVGKNTYKK